jgi:hypothetical protein
MMILDPWRSSPTKPAGCMTSIRQQPQQDAPSEYDLILLVDSVESLPPDGTSAGQSAF